MYLLAVRRLRFTVAVVLVCCHAREPSVCLLVLGSAQANYAYLRHRRHTGTQSATVVAVNNLLGLVGHALIVLVVLLFASDYSRHLAASSEHKIGVTFRWIGIFLLVALAIGLVLRHKRLKQTLATIQAQIGIYRRRLRARLGAALLSSMLLTLCNILCLYSCMIALGVHLPFIVVVLIFSFGLSTGAVTPTPGGLGGFEAGLVAGFVAYHVGSASGTGDCPCSSG